MPLPQDNKLWRIVGHLSEALSQSFVGMLRDPRPLVPFVEHPDPWIAYLALRMVDFLQDIQLEDYAKRPSNLPLKLLTAKAATHPHWWVRYVAASLLPPSAPVGAYLRLLSDPEPAVVAEVSSRLLELSPNKAEQIVRRLPSGSQATLRLYLHRWLEQEEVVKELLSEEYQVVRSLHAILEPLSKQVNHFLRDHLERLQQLSPQELPSLSSETLALLSSDFFPPFGMQVPSEVLDKIIHFHPDPIAKVIALEWHGSCPSDSALLQAVQQEHLPTVVRALLSLQWRISAGNYSRLGRLILELTDHSCPLVVQIAARALKEAVDCSHPDEQLVSRLVFLLDHADPLVRINALHSLQDYWAAPTSICEHLLHAWEKEPISVVKVAFARTLWWLMSPKEWWSKIGIWLWGFESGRWRYLVRERVSIWGPREAEEALEVVKIAYLRRLLRKRIAR